MDLFQQIHKIITSFDRFKKQALEKYLASPYFQVSPEIITLIQTWNKIDEDATPDKAAYKSFLGNPKAALLRSTLDVLLKFIQQYEFDQLSTLKANANLAGVRRNNIEKLYKDTLSNIEKLPVTEFDQSSEYFFYRSLIEKNIFELKTENEKKNAKVKIASELNMHKISENVDIFYILEMLKNTLISVLESPEEWKVINKLPEVQFSLEASKVYDSKVPVMALYRNAWFMLGMKKITKAQLEQWEHAYQEIKHKIPELELEMITSARNLFLYNSN